jgi:hypothetical protein
MRELEIDNGGPAFPSEEMLYHGMSLRDYFAAAAVPALVEPAIAHLRRESNPPEADHVATRVASWAYMVADAMLTARQQKQD